MGVEVRGRRDGNVKRGVCFGGAELAFWCFIDRQKGGYARIWAYGIGIALAIGLVQDHGEMVLRVWDSDMPAGEFFIALNLVTGSGGGICIE